MLRSYIKIAFRALTRSKAHSAINIVGLSLGIAVCILITLFVRDEWTFDKFHSKAERIYRVYAREDWGENQQFASANVPFPMGPALKDNLPEVEYQVRLNKVGTQVKVGDNIYTETLDVAGKDFFKVFDFKLLKGDRETALEKQDNVLLTEETALKYFGEADPVGKTISIQLNEKFEEFNVAGVIENIRSNSSISFSLLASDLNFTRMFSERTLTEAWFNISPETYVLLHEGTDPKVLEGKFPALFRTLLGEDQYKQSKYAPGLQLITDIHLDKDAPGGYAPVSDPKYSLILGAIALLILFVACINFVTLSIGRSLKRAKEVGIRKVVGAVRTQLITQFIGEATIIASISMLIGLTLAVLALPVFNELAAKQLLFPFNSFLAVVLGVLLLIIGLISGSYPAFVLSAFRPVAILKGVVQSGNKQTLRKVLVGVQLVLSIFLITCTLVMRNQLGFLQEKNLGFNKEQLVVVPMNLPRGPRLAELAKLGFEKTEQFKVALSGKPGIKEICAANHGFGSLAWMNIGYTDIKGVYRTTYVNAVDADYIPVMKMEMVQGRNFEEANTSDKRRSVIVNEAFVKELGWDIAVGKKIPGAKFEDHEIIGVVKDFNYMSLYNKVGPVILVMSPEPISAGIENINTNDRPTPKLIVRLNPGETAQGVEEIQKAWEKLAAGEEFKFTFVDDALQSQYASDLNLGKIVNVATALAILIGSLGLYGLASLAMQNRTKEITIRKVLGATQNSLLVLLSREYIVLIAICLLISVPLTIYMMQAWLSTFEYRVNIGWLVFMVSGGISLFIAMMTVGYQVLATASTQPAQSLKYE
ncbi:MAG: ABC transporter permease [Bacteroidota bacterium]